MKTKEISHGLKRTVAAMLWGGIPRRQIVKEASPLYGLLVECVEGVVAAAPA